MSPAEVAIGVLVLVTSGLALADAARRLARRMWPADLLAQVSGGLVLGMSLLVVVMEVLGTLGALGSIPVLAISVLTWLVTVIGLRVVSSAEVEHPTRIGALPPVPATVAIPLLALIVLLGSAIVRGLLLPHPEFDAFSGHLPVAVQWLQAGNTRILPYISPLSVPAQYPGNAELMALWLMVPVHRDFLVQLATVPGAAAVVAGIMLTARELGAHTMAAFGAALLVLTMPRVLDHLIGTNMQDVPALGAVAMLAGFVALDRTAPSRPGLLVAGLAAGVAVGTRYAALLAVTPLLLVLLVQVLKRRPGPRALLGSTLLVSFGVIATGAYWYIRNTLLTGDPVYPQSLPGHPVDATEKLVFPWIRSYVQLGWAPHDWLAAAKFGAQLDGPILAVLVIAALAAPIVTLRSGERNLVGWLWALLPAVALLGFLATPGGAGYLVDGQLVPGQQAQSLRYIVLSLPLPAAALAVQLTRMPGRWGPYTLPAVLGLGLVSTIALTWRDLSKIGIAAALVATGAALLLLRIRPPARLSLAAGALGAILFAAVAPAIARHYDGQRTAAGIPFESASVALSNDRSVAIAGFCEIYGLYGPDLSRRVEYLTGADDRVDRPLATTYEDWLDSLRRHQVTALVVASDACFLEVPVPQADWASAHGDVFTLVYSDSSVRVYRLRP